MALGIDNKSTSIWPFVALCGVWGLLASGLLISRWRR
jgi:hypothetical protein